MANGALFHVVIETRSNADWVVAFEYLAADVPVDLTGSTLALMVRKRREDHEAIVAVDTADGNIVITNPALGKFQVKLPQISLERMAAGEYLHDLIRTRPDGLLEAMWEGELIHEIGVTR